MYSIEIPEQYEDSPAAKAVRLFNELSETFINDFKHVLGYKLPLTPENTALETEKLAAITVLPDGRQVEIVSITVLSEEFILALFGNPKEIEHCVIHYTHLHVLFRPKLL